MRSCGLSTLNYVKMTIEETEEKLSNMHFDSIVKSYCNKVNDIERLKAEVEKLKEQLRIHNVVGQSEQLKCQCKKAKFTRTVDADFNPLCGRCGKAL